MNNEEIIKEIMSERMYMCSYCKRSVDGDCKGELCDCYDDYPLFIEKD